MPRASSLIPPWMFRKSTRLEFIGTALPDTVLAGAGGRTFTEGAGHFAPRRPPGVPTFDITPFMQPYHDALPDSTVRDGMPRPRVRSERLLRFFDELWVSEAALDSMSAPDWDARVRADTSLAGQWPVTEFLRDIR